MTINPPSVAVLRCVQSAWIGPRTGEVIMEYSFKRDHFATTPDTPAAAGR